MVLRANHINYGMVVLGHLTHTHHKTIGLFCPISPSKTCWDTRYQSVPECTRVYRSLVSVSKSSIIKLSKIGPKCCKMIIKLCIKTGHPVYNLNVSIFDLNVQLMRYVCILSSTICINITLFILQWLSVSQCAFFGESRKSGKSHAYWMSDPEYIRMPPCQIQSEE